jgi:CBS domain-containing protein
MNTPVSALIERKGTSVHAVTPSMTIAEAVAEMNRHRIGCVVVLDGGRLAGVFTERDVLRRVVGAGLDPKAVRISDVMTRNVFTIAPETSVEETMILFAERRCRHLPVMEEGRLLGLISIGDISRWMAQTHQAEAEQLKNYISGGYSAA